MNGKYIQELRDCEVEIMHIQQWIKKNVLDSNVRYLTSYAVIKACGTIEYVLKQMIFDRLSDGANVEAQNYFTKIILDASFNPSTGQMDRLLERLNSNWKKKFDQAIKGKKEKGELNSLVDLRNSFAHGSVITASINDVMNYFQSGKWILEELYQIINDFEVNIVD